MKSLDEIEQEIYADQYLADTIAILIGYDGFDTVDTLKDLIDETRERLVKLYRHEVTRADVYGKEAASNRTNP